MVEDEEQTFVDKMYWARGYILDFYKVMAAMVYPLRFQAVQTPPGTV